MDCVGLSGTTSLLSIPRANSVETDTIAAKAVFECRQFDSPQVCDRLYLKVLQLFFRDFAYSGQAVNGHNRNESISSGCMTKSPSGFFQSEAIFARFIPALGKPPRTEKGKSHSPETEESTKELRNRRRRMKSMAKKGISPGAVHRVPADLRKVLLSDAMARAKWENATRAQ